MSNLAPRHFIGGEWVDPISKGTIPVVNPFTEEPWMECAAGTSADVDAAVASASNALKSWKCTTGAERAVFLRAIALEVLARKAELSTRETTDNGKPFPESEWDVDDVAATFNLFADKAVELDAKQMTPVDVGDAEYEAFLRQEPAGVVAAIVPWNYPALMATWKLAPALAAGCTIVLKPSELTPATAMNLGEILIKVGLPAGVVNIVFGTGPDVGAHMVRHPLVNKCSFTGSVVTGMDVMRGAAESVKGVTLELGGKSPAIVFKDADMATAVEWVMFGCFWTNGQICSATSRLLVHDSVADEFVAALASHAANIKMGNPMDPECRLGPLVSQAQQQKVLGMIETARKQGAEVVCGGRAQDKSMLPTGYFVQPTVLRVTEKMDIWNEEVFGPVLSVVTFKDEADAVEKANKNKYGLAGAVFSQDGDVLMRVANALECGMVWQNCSQPCFPHLPWGGTKLSGIGRDLGEHGLSAYLEPKQVVRRVVSEPLGWYDMSGQNKS